MAISDPILLTRDCTAVEIPAGTAYPLRQGSPVRITQSLGGSCTVLTDEGRMVRISEQDADALGIVKEELTGELSANLSLEEQIWDQLRTCYDPEIPANIVELGLIYFCGLSPMEEGAQKVEVKMTLTAPGCGMGDVLKSDIQRKLIALPGVQEANVEVVFDPPWNQGMMSEAARLQLGMDYY